MPTHSATDYKNGVKLVTPEPLSGTAGQMLNDNFRVIADAMDLGFSGYSGYSGYSGASVTGASGYSGYSGLNGASGYSGYSGASVTGTSGYSGYSGPGVTAHAALTTDAHGGIVSSTDFATHTGAAGGPNAHGAVAANTASRIIARASDGSFAAGAATLSRVQTGGVTNPDAGFYDLAAVNAYFSGYFTAGGIALNGGRVYAGSGGSLTYWGGSDMVAALTWDGSGRVILPGLPTSATGLPTGAVWNDAGTLKIVT